MVLNLKLVFFTKFMLVNQLPIFELENIKEACSYFSTTKEAPIEVDNSCEKIGNKELGLNLEIMSKSF